ncbi:hypothetical protein PENSPDRAFT_754011 [Peniophora sp. CONT]|nr:hypothetical protein PENSPDRAFT_754011 [Peniophora sp. CONT]
MANDVPNPSLQSLVLSRFSDRALSGIPHGLQLQTVDAELETLLQTFYRARQMRNSRVGPCRLPREILAYVFECLQPLWLPRREFDEKDPAGLKPIFCSGWMSVTHVCSFWREVALNVPSLWSKPTINVRSIPHQYIPDILFRSRSATLDLKVIRGRDFNQTRQDANVAAWLSPAILRRARRLYIMGDTELTTYLAQLLPSSHDMDCLHGLTAYALGGLANLPTPFHNLPEVMNLTLWGFQVPWQCPLLSSRLTELRLLYPRHVEPRPSYEEFCRLLCLLQSLQVLELLEMVPHRPSPVGGHLPNIIMAPSLRELKIAIVSAELATDAAVFISLLHTHPRCTRYYKITQLGTHDPDMTFVDNAIRRLVPNISLASCDDIEMRHLLLTANGLQLAGTAIPRQTASPSSRSPKLDLATITNGLHIPHFSKRDATLDFHLTNYLSLVTLERLLTISLDTSSLHLIARNNLWPCLFRANGVRRIGWVNDSTPTSYVSPLLDALRVPRAFGAGDETRILFPQLEALALPLAEDEFEHRDVIIGIIDLVHARLQNGAPLLELVISREAAHWAVWSTLRAMLKITFMDYAFFESPMMPKADSV